MISKVNFSAGSRIEELMPKTKSVFVCQNCGAQSPKWVGKCASCEEWNTYVEEVIEKSGKTPSWKNPTGNLVVSRLFPWQRSPMTNRIDLTPVILN